MKPADSRLTCPRLATSMRLPAVGPDERFNLTAGRGADVRRKTFAVALCIAAGLAASPPIGARRLRHHFAARHVPGRQRDLRPRPRNAPKRTTAASTMSRAATAFSFRASASSTRRRPANWLKVGDFVFDFCARRAKRRRRFHVETLRRRRQRQGLQPVALQRQNPLSHLRWRARRPKTLWQTLWKALRAWRQGTSLRRVVPNHLCMGRI